MEKRYFRPSEVEQLCGIRAVTVRSYVTQGKIKGIKSGRMVLVSAADLLAKLKRAESGEPWDDVFCLPSHEPASPV